MHSWVLVAVAAAALLSPAHALFFDFLPASRRGRANINTMHSDNQGTRAAKLRSPPLRAADGGDADTEILRSLLEAVMGTDEPVQPAQQAASFLELPLEEPLLKVEHNLLRKFI